MRVRLFSDVRSWIAASCAALLAFGATALVVSLPGYRPRDFLVRNLESRTESLPETEVLPHVRRMATLGDEGIAAVAGLLKSENEVVAEAARSVLSEQLDNWSSLPVEESAPRAIHLARILADSEAPSSPEARRYRTDLGIRLLLWRAPNAQQAGVLAAHCEQILITSGRAEREGDRLGCNESSRERFEPCVASPAVSKDPLSRGRSPPNT